jgi:hypothetical protein
MKTGELGQAKIEKIPSRSEEHSIPPRPPFCPVARQGLKEDERDEKLPLIFPILLLDPDRAWR